MAADSCIKTTERLLVLKAELLAPDLLLVIPGGITMGAVPNQIESPISASILHAFESSRKHPLARVVDRNVILRPGGYVIPGYQAISMTVKLGNDFATGFGEGPVELAETKATAEAIERLALNLYCREKGQSETSNGWAAHLSEDLAVRNALFELIERDVAVSVWENGGPFYIIPTSLWPERLQAWREHQETRAEYFDLRIYLSTGTNGACITALLMNARQNFVAGHASCEDLDAAILSAVNECFRAAHQAVRLHWFTEVLALHAEKDTGSLISPGAHSLAYAYHKKTPAEVRFEALSDEQILGLWSEHQALALSLSRGRLDVDLFEFGPHIVARVTSPRFSPMIWGRKGGDKRPNKSPHFVG